MESTILTSQHYPPPALPPTTPLLAYRSTSPRPPTYQATPKAYLTIDDLYMRYAPLKSIRPVRLITVLPTLTIHDLYAKFYSKPPPTPKLLAHELTTIIPALRRIYYSKTSSIASFRSGRVNPKTAKAPVSSAHAPRALTTLLQRTIVATKLTTYNSTTYSRYRVHSALPSCRYGNSY